VDGGVSSIVEQDTEPDALAGQVVQSRSHRQTIGCHVSSWGSIRSYEHMGELSGGWKQDAITKSGSRRELTRRLRAQSIDAPTSTPHLVRPSASQVSSHDGQEEVKVKRTHSASDTQARLVR
jgi:hypothetical protein